MHYFYRHVHTYRHTTFTDTYTHLQTHTNHIHTQLLQTDTYTPTDTLL
jgi:hypothetical protein